MKREKAKQMKAPKGNRSMLMGAAFLMATSAIGPGFLTQTTVFTQQLAASFGFVILISILLDIFAQTSKRQEKRWTDSHKSLVLS